MDNVMDRPVEKKIGAQDIIRANAQAEALEAARTKQEAENYKTQLEELRQGEKEHKKAIDDANESLVSLSRRIDENETRIHDVGVQVYRNVQAVVEKGLQQEGEQLRKLSDMIEQESEQIRTLSDRKELEGEQLKKFSDMIEQDGAQLRNLSDMIEGRLPYDVDLIWRFEKNEKAVKELKEQLDGIQVGMETKNSAVTPLLIITMLLAAADLAVTVLIRLGIF